MTKKRMHSLRESHADSSAGSGTEKPSSFAWLDEESGELLRVQVWSTNETFVDEFTSMGFQRPPFFPEKP